MHLNYYFLKHLVKELRDALTGKIVIECFSQNKDELIFVLSEGDDMQYIRAYLSGSFSCLTFPDNFHRARRNSIDLFPEIIGKRLNEISITSNDRSFLVHLSDGFRLLFKLHGNRSNIMLYDDSGFLGMFNHSLKKDEFVRPDGLAKNATTTQEDWLTNTDLKSAFPTFGPTVNRYLKSQGFESETADDQWSMIKDLLECFELSHFLINQGDGPPYLSFFRMDEVLSEHQSAIEACNALSKYYHQTYLFERDKGKYLQQLKSDYQKAMKYVDHTRQKMDLLSQKRPFDELANIIMANLHAIPKGASKVELYDFYRNSQIEIKLKPESSPQHQAEQYYRKSKNRFKEKENLELNLQKKAAEIEEKQRLIDEITAISDRKKLNQFVPAHFPDKTNTKNDIRLPFYRHDIDGFEIRIGKSAKDNDLMLRQFSHKDDLWLHARDVSGSHVLIKHQKKTAISASIIERAAQMAAFYSKRKHDTLAPVIYTPRKFVRKAKNLLPGQVLVEKEQVIIVSPLKEPKPSH